ncbi:flagellar protein FliS [Paenibacillus hexagrammi]|uniref:Flagellar protein FliS n=1 Tax=Paenibacillus hexagrammi TaxID=2908839 RepID=A0ABY3SJN6_9BACL|nr:flagellar export chaperone FliS [Paenibacillus sp. YPD9-1]UJF33192.1 flagellar protein FliS [Paenibacillus sp. YPD9-1]
MKVHDIIMEFVITLDRSVPLSDNLMSLYDYFIFRLKEANSKKIIEPIQEVMGLLTELREAWVEAAKIAMNPSTTATGTQHA